MANNIFLILLFFFFFFFFLLSTTTADPNDFIYAGCTGTKYTEGSPYQYNVDSTLSSIANAASSSPFGKFTSSNASPSSPVNGLFQCRGDLTPQLCQSCIRTALSKLSPICSSSSGAAVQLDGCLVRYGNESFIGKEETNLLYKKCGPAPPNGYDPNLMGMRDDALAAIASSGGTGGTYRVGAAGFVQAAAQCVGDLSTKDCSDCVSTAISQLKTICGSSVSGGVYLGKCFAKYYSSGESSSSSSYSSSSSSSYTPSDHNHSGGDEAGKTLAIIIGLLAGVALIIVFLSFIRRAGSGKY